MGRRATHVFMLGAALAISLMAGCGPEKKQPRAESLPGSPLERAFERMGPVKIGSLMVEPVKFTRLARNIEDERWEATLRITSSADIDTLCNVTLRIRDAEGRVLQEHIIFSDAVPYIGTINHSDIFFVSRDILPIVASTGFEFNCVMEEMLRE